MCRSFPYDPTARSISFQVDILVNNGARGQLGLIRKTSLEVDRAILDLNTVGTISLTKAILPHMIERREGQIVIVSSLSGKSGKNLSLLNILIQKVMKMLKVAQAYNDRHASSHQACPHSNTDQSFSQLTFSVPRATSIFPQQMQCKTCIIKKESYEDEYNNHQWENNLSQLILYQNVWRSVWRICLRIQDGGFII